MNTQRGIYGAKEYFMVLVFSMLSTPWILGDECNWTYQEAQQALTSWKNTIGGFHSKVEGSNPVSYREMIESWGSIANPSSPAYQLLCAFDTFVREVNAWPGDTSREENLLDCIYEIARSEVLLGTEDLIEVLDQEHLFAVDPSNPAAYPNPLEEEILFLKGPKTNPIDSPIYGVFPQGRRDCIGHYSDATSIFLKAFSSSPILDIMASPDYSNTNDLMTSKIIRSMGLLCRASARKVRSYAELAQRQYARDFDRNDPDAPQEARKTALISSQAAYLDAIVIAAVLPDEAIKSLTDTQDYQTIRGNILEMGKVYSNITRGLNPFGYHPYYVAFRFDPVVANSLGQRNNFEQMYYHLEGGGGRNYLGEADNAIAQARGETNKSMRDRVREIERDYNQFQLMIQNQTNQDAGVRAQYRLELAGILGYGSSSDGLDNDQDKVIDNPEEDTEPDQISYLSNTGEIGQIVSEIKKSQLRAERIDQEMDNNQSMINIKMELLSRLLEINEKQIQQRTGIVSRITKEKMNIVTETGEILAKLAEEEARKQKETAKRKGWVKAIQGGIQGGIAGGQAGGGWGAIGGAVLGVGMSGFDSYQDIKLMGNLGDIQARRERAKALEQSKLVYQDGEMQIQLSELDAQIYSDRTNAEFEAEIKSLILNSELMTIDMLMADEDLRQQTMRLSSAMKRAVRLLEDRKEFEQRVATTQQLMEFYQDPSSRVLEDQLILIASDEFQKAAEMVYLTGKAMEYQINDEYPRIDDVFRARTVTALQDIRKDLFDKYYNTPNIHIQSETTSTLSLRRDLLGLPFNDSKANAKFLDFIKQNINSYGDLSINFNTYLTCGNFRDEFLPLLNFFGQPSTRYRDYFPYDRWNERIINIRVNLNGMSNVDENGVSAVLTQNGTSYIRSRHAQINELDQLVEDDVRAWNLEPRTTGSFIASVDGQYAANDPAYYNDQLVARSVAACDWRLTIKGRGLSNAGDFMTISDIEIIIRSSGYPLQWSP